MATQNGKVLRSFLLFFLVVGLTFWVFRKPVLIHLADYLIISDPLEKADVIEVLSGDEVVRCHKAADLFHQGWAPRILVTKSVYPYAIEELQPYGIRELDSHEKCVAILQFWQVPARAIEVVDGYNESTADEAVKLQRYLHERHLMRLIVVTSNFHTRRSRLLFRRVLAGSGIQVSVQAAPPNSFFNAQDWWTRRRDSKTLLWEYQKLAFYALRYW